MRITELRYYVDFTTIKFESEKGDMIEVNISNSGTRFICEDVDIKDLEEVINFIKKGLYEVKWS